MIGETSQLFAMKFIVKIPSPFSYIKDNVVPQRYVCNIFQQTPLSVPDLVSTKDMCTTTTTDVIGLGGMTCSGQCYAPRLMRVGQWSKGTKEAGVEVATPVSQENKNSNNIHWKRKGW